MRVAARISHFAFTAPMVAIMAHVFGIMLSILMWAVSDYAALAVLILAG